MKKIILITLVLSCNNLLAQKNNHRIAISSAAEKIEKKVIEWRHDIHQHPELANRETRTAALIAKHLQSLGMEVKTNVAVTGVVGILKGDKPGPVIGTAGRYGCITGNRKNRCSICIKG